MKNMLYFFLLLILILITISMVLTQKVHKLANSNILIKKETIFLLKNGTGRIALSKQLHHESIIINQPYIFQCLLYIKPELAHFKAGAYRFIPNMTVYKMLQLLASGKEAQFPLRLVEGMRLSDYLKQLRNAPYIKHTLNDDKYETAATALKLKNIKWIEGWFWPDTWMYTANTTDVTLLKYAHYKMVNIVEKIWKERDKKLPYKNQNQLVTMASLIEKETAINTERNYIASVFINRLHANMRLQTDPTVIYGMGLNYNGKISRRDLTTPNEYNTYIINGLPPGPIAIPGRASLSAAAHPAKTHYLYFVANGKGRHIFNTNLISHNRSVKNYLKKIT